MIKQSDIAAELYKRRQARKSLQDYISYVNKSFVHSSFSTAVCKALDKFISDCLAGIRPVLILQAPPQHGKQMADETLVLTTHGWKTHGELIIGDHVFAPDGSTTKVIAISEKTNSRAKVELTDGSVFYCHERHEWNVYSRDLKREITIETVKMLELGCRTQRTHPLYSEIIGKRDSRFYYNLPSIKPISGTPQKLIVSPYTLGAWLGDGTRIAPRISGDIKDVKIIEGIVLDGYEIMSQWVHNKTGVVTTSFKGLWKDLKAIGVTSMAGKWVDKHIPEQYMVAPIEDRLELLAGLIDTDGYIYQKNGRVCFTTAEKTLCDSFAQLLSTFGWRATIVKESPKLSSSGIQGIKDYYVISFNPDINIPCRLDRKTTTILSKQRRISIKSITVGDWGKSGNCIQVDRSDGLYLVGNNLIPTHNSEMVSRHLPAYLLGKFPDWRIAAASYSSTLADSMSLDVRRNLVSPEHLILFPLPEEKRKYSINRNGEFTSPYGKGAYIGDGVGGGFTGKPADIFIIDDPIKNAQEALSPTVKEGHWNWYQSTCKTRMSKNSGQIIMATSWAEDDLSARIIDLHRGDPRLTVLKFSAINDPGEVGYNPDLPLGPLVPELHPLEQLLELKAESSDYWWSAMYQQSPKSLGGNIFKESSIKYYLPKDLPTKFDKVIASWDCTFKDTDGTDFVVGQVWGKKGADSYLLDQIRARLSFTDTVLNVILLRDRWKATREILIEDKANGPAVIDVLKKRVPGIIPIEPDGSKIARAHAITSFWEAGNIYLPHPDIAPWIKEFVSELTAFPAGAHDDQVDAMTQAIRRLYPTFSGLNISQAAINKMLCRG